MACRVLKLTRRSDGWFWIRLSTEVELVQEPLALAMGMADPVPTDLEIAIAAKSVSINPALLALLDDLGVLGDELESGDRQDKAEPGQVIGGTDQGELQLEGIRLIIQEVLFNALIHQPARKSLRATLRTLRMPMHIRYPVRQCNLPRLDQSNQHPGQGLPMSHIEPLTILAQNLNQNIIRPKRVLHALPS